MVVVCRMLFCGAEYTEFSAERWNLCDSTPCRSEVRRFSEEGLQNAQRNGHGGDADEKDVKRGGKEAVCQQQAQPVALAAEPGKGRVQNKTAQHHAHVVNEEVKEKEQPEGQKGVNQCAPTPGPGFVLACGRRGGAAQP